MYLHIGSARVRERPAYLRTYMENAAAAGTRSISAGEPTDQPAPHPGSFKVMTRCMHLQVGHGGHPRSLPLYNMSGQVRYGSKYER